MGRCSPAARSCVGASLVGRVSVARATTQGCPARDSSGDAGVDPAARPTDARRAGARPAPRGCSRRWSRAATGPVRRRGRTRRCAPSWLAASTTVRAAGWPCRFALRHRHRARPPRAGRGRPASSGIRSATVPPVSPRSQAERGLGPEDDGERPGPELLHQRPGVVGDVGGETVDGAVSGHEDGGWHVAATALGVEERVRRPPAEKASAADAVDACRWGGRRACRRARRRGLRDGLGPAVVGGAVEDRAHGGQPRRAIGLLADGTPSPRPPESGPCGGETRPRRREVIPCEAPA